MRYTIKTKHESRLDLDFKKKSKKRHPWNELGKFEYKQDYQIKQYDRTADNFVECDNGIVDIQENVFFLESCRLKSLELKCQNVHNLGGNDSANINRKTETVNKKNWQLSNLA